MRPRPRTGTPRMGTIITAMITGMIITMTTMRTTMARRRTPMRIRTPRAIRTRMRRLTPTPMLTRMGRVADAAMTMTNMTMTTRTRTTRTRMIMRMGPRRATSTRMADAGLLVLQVWLSPAFPVGAFAYSHGLEWAVETGQVSDAASAQAWIADLLDHGSGRNDAVLLAAAYRAAESADRAALRRAAELALALQPSGERRLEATAQGNAFMIAVRSAWPCAAVDAFAADWTDDVAYPVALGVAAAGHGAPLAAVLEAALLAFVGNLVSAVVRLGPNRADGRAADHRRHAAPCACGGRLRRDLDPGRCRGLGLSVGHREPAARDAVFAALSLLKRGRPLAQDVDARAMTSPPPDRARSARRRS